MRPIVLQAAPAASGALYNAAGRVVWWSWRNTSTTTPAVLRLWDGSSAAGRLLFTISLAPTESTRDFPGWHSLPFDIGLWLEVVSGAMEGVVAIVPEDAWPGDGIPVVVVGGVTVNVDMPAGG